MKGFRFALLVLLSLSSCTISFGSRTTSLSSNSSEEKTSSISDSSSSEEDNQSESSLSSSSSAEDSQSESSSFSSSQGEGVATPMSEDFLALFDPSSSVSISLSLSNEAIFAISSLQSDSSSIYNDFYFPGDFEISLNGRLYRYEEVGVRMKGNTSRTQFADSTGSIYGIVHFKISFKATFDDSPYLTDSSLIPFHKDWTGKESEKKEREDRNLFGLTKLDLKYVPRSDGYLNEVYSYQSFRENGVLAPYASLANFTLNSETDSSSSIYEIIEPIDKQFLKKRFSKAEAKGDLYKCVYIGFGPANLARQNAIYKDGESYGSPIPLGSIGVEDNYSSYRPAYQKKTNDSKMQESDFSKMANFISSLWSVVYGDEGKDKLEEILDVEQFLSFSAISYLLGNPDDFRCNSNNYYIYFLPSNGKAIFIPYDYDWSIGAKWSWDIDYLVYSSPFDESSLSNSASSLLYATFYKGTPSGSKISYDRKGYQSSYEDKVKSFSSKVLSSSFFSSLCEKSGYSQDKDRVLDYFSIKKGVI